MKPQFRKGFVYSDGWVDDARLVALCALDAAERGATVLTRTACVDAVRGAERWQLNLQSADGAMRQVSARALVNAAGPWAAEFLMAHAHVADRVHLRLIKGSHIVVPKLFEHDHAYIFQNPDGRIIFAIPYEGEFTLIGTTDVEHHGAIGEARAEPDEIAYLCEQASRYFAKPVTPDEVVWTYSGVRPLIDDESGNPAAVTRDYRLELDSGREGAAQAPLLSVWGGKITTFRKLAEEAADRLAPLLSGTAARRPLDRARDAARRRSAGLARHGGAAGQRRRRNLRALRRRAGGASSLAAGSARATPRTRLRNPRRSGVEGRPRPRGCAAGLRSRARVPAPRRVGAQR